MQNLTLPSEVEVFGDYKLKQTKKKQMVLELDQY